MGTRYSKEIEDYVKNWKDELRSAIMIGKAAGRKPPSLTVIEVGEGECCISPEVCKDLGIVVDWYKIPEDSGIDQKELNKLVYNCVTDGIVVRARGLDAAQALRYSAVEKDVGCARPESVWNRGIVQFMKSRDIGVGRAFVQGAQMDIAKMLLDLGWTVVLGPQFDGGEYDVIIEENKELEEVGILANVVEAWKRENL